MKTRSNKALIACYCVIFILTIACNSFNIFLKPTAIPTMIPTATSEPEILHFENDLIAFDYPEGLIFFSSGDPGFSVYPGEIKLGGELVIGLADQAWIKDTTLYSSIRIFRHPFPPGSTLDDVIREAYKPVPLLNEEVIEESGPVTIDDLAAYQKTYRVASGPLWYTMHDIWLEKDNSILRISFWEEVYEENFKTTAELVRNSLEIQDHLPPFIERPTPVSTASPTPYPATLLKHFENSFVSFDYPQELVIFQSGDTPSACFPDFQLGGELVVGLGDPKFLDRDQYYRSIRVFRLAMPPGSNLESIFMEAYRPIEKKYLPEPGVLNLSVRITIDGLTALQKTYRITSGEPSYELRDIWIQKDNQIFILSIWSVYTNPDDFSLFQSGADAFLNSLGLR